MLISIIQHTPVWVWALLCALVALGLSQTRPREMSMLRVQTVPLLLIALSSSGVLSAFGHLPVALGGWAAGFGAALAFARNAVTARGATWSSSTATLRVPGSWLPLSLMMGLFGIKYFAGISLAMNPALASNAAFAGWCSLAYGSISGLFLARALSLRRLALPEQRLKTA